MEYTVEAFVEDCMREGKEGSLSKLIAMRHKEMTDKGYVKNKEGFWVEANQEKHG